MTINGRLYTKDLKYHKCTNLNTTSWARWLYLCVYLRSGYIYFDVYFKRRAKCKQTKRWWRKGAGRMAHTNQIYRDHIERRFKVEVWSGFVVSASSDPFVTSRRASSSSSSHRIVKYCVIRVCDSPNPPSLFLFCFVFFFIWKFCLFYFNYFRRVLFCLCEGQQLWRKILSLIVTEAAAAAEAWESAARGSRVDRECLERHRKEPRITRGKFKFNFNPTRSRACTCYPIEITSFNFEMSIATLLLVAAILAGIGRAAILDPMTAMRDDISRIKVMMETVGGNAHPDVIYYSDLRSPFWLVSFIRTGRANGALQWPVPEQAGDSIAGQRYFPGPHRQVVGLFWFSFFDLCLIFHCHISSNVKNLQERAHVWDTFQLHVSAWNEQIKSVDKKLDILSRSACL